MDVATLLVHLNVKLPHVTGEEINYTWLISVRVDIASAPKTVDSGSILGLGTKPKPSKAQNFVFLAKIT